MPKRLLTHHRCLLTAGVLALAIGSNEMEAAPEAAKVLRNSGVKGGLVCRSGDFRCEHKCTTIGVDVACRTCGKHRQRHFYL